MIPKRIHQIWIGPRPVPWKLMDTWREMHPGWEINLWTEHKQGWVNQAQIDVFAERGEWAGAADVMRYEVLHRHGGIFVDADSKCLKPLDDRFLTPACFAAYENEKSAPGMVANGMLAAEQNSPLMKEMIFECSRAPVAQMPAWRCVGPVLLTRVAERHPELEIFPARTFYPRHWGGALAPGNSETFASQMWCSTKDTYDQFC